MLALSAAAALWGSAAARADDPGDARCRHFARSSACFLLLGLVILLLPDAWLMSLGIGFEFWKKASAWDALYYFEHAAERLLLFWSCVETLRSAKDPELTVPRALRVERLMRIRFLLSVVSWLVSVLTTACVARADPGLLLLSNSWDLIVYFTLDGVGEPREGEPAPGPEAIAAIRDQVSIVTAGKLTARLGRNALPREGGRADLAVDLEHLYFFDPKTGAAIVR